MTDTRLIVLDRDGVLNEMLNTDGKRRGPWSVSELVLIPDAAAAVALAAAAGYRLVVATNQPDIARDWVSAAAVAEINAAIGAAIPEIEHFYQCAHDNADNCSCRKPKPGLLLQAAADLGASPATSWMIGDRWTDIGAGNAAGFRSVLIASDYSMQATHHGDEASPVAADITVKTLTEAVEAILATEPH